MAKASKWAPAFSYYPKDFVSDPLVVPMTAEQVGCYWLLVSFCWMQKGVLPTDPARLAPLARVSEQHFREVIWPAIGSCFVLMNERSLSHPRLRRERQGQLLYKKKMAEAGQRGAKSRWDKEKRNNASDDQAIARPLNKDGLGMASDGFPSPSPFPSATSVTDTDNLTSSTAADPVAAWRAADGRTLPQLAETVAAYAPQFPHMTPLEACRSWCQANKVPVELVSPIMQALDRMPRGRDVPDDFGPSGDHERLTEEFEPVVAFIAEREGLDTTEVVGEASEYNGHRYLSLRSIPANRHKRLVHTVNALRKWRRKLEGKAEPNAKAPPGRKSVGERTADTVRRMIARRRPDARPDDVAGEIHSGAGEAGRGLPPGDGRPDR